MSAQLHVAGGFSGRLNDCLSQVECRLVTGGPELEEIFRLRYEAYVREGIVPIDPGRRFADAYDEAPNVWIFGIYMDGELASSIRVHVASPECPVSPSVDVFPDILKPAIEKGQTVVDPTRFVAHRRLARRHPELPYITVRLGFLASERYRADMGLASVRAEHQAFYKRVFLLNPLCEPRTFPNLSAQFVLMGVDYLSVKERIIARYPFMASTEEELAALFGPESPYPRNMAASAVRPLNLAPGGQDAELEARAAASRLRRLSAE